MESRSKIDLTRYYSTYLQIWRLATRLYLSKFATVLDFNLNPKSEHAKIVITAMGHERYLVDVLDTVSPGNITDTVCRIGSDDTGRKVRPSWNSWFIDSPIYVATIRVIITHLAADASLYTALCSRFGKSVWVCWFYTQYISGCTPCRFQSWAQWAVLM